MALFMSSVTGHFVDAEFAAANPETTFEVKRVTTKQLRKEIAVLRQHLTLSQQLIDDVLVWYNAPELDLDAESKLCEKVAAYLNEVDELPALPEPEQPKVRSRRG